MAIGFVRGSWDTAEDLVSEATLRLLHCPEKVNPDNWRRLMKTVVRNLAIDGHRRRTTRPQEAYDIDTSAVASNENTAKTATNRHLVQQATAQLSPHHQQIIDLVYIQGHTIPEASKIANLPLGTARSRVSYALASLRAILRQNMDIRSLADLQD